MSTMTINKVAQRSGNSLGRDNRRIFLMPIQRNCEWCSASYEAERKERRYCSIACAAKHRASTPEWRAQRASLVLSDEARAKMSASQKRRMSDPVQRERFVGANRGRKLSDEHRAKISAAFKGRTFTPGHLEKLRVAGVEREQPIGERAYRWRGDAAVSNSIHAWITKHYPKTGICEDCRRNVGPKTQAGTHYAFRFHGVKGYTRDRADYRELCPPCHMAFDREWRESKRAAR